MNLRPHRRESPDINLTPLIDVVFLLLIFFMVSTTFREDGRIRLQLPEANAEAVPAETIELVEVMVDRGGRFYVNQQLVRDQDLETLKQALVGTVGAERDLPVLVRADAQAQHQAVMRVLDAAGQLGMQRIAFAASQPRTGSAAMDAAERRLEPGAQSQAEQLTGEAGEQPAREVPALAPDQALEPAADDRAPRSGADQ